jgi:hypothetical protein
VTADTQRRVCRRLEPSKVEELIQGYSDAFPSTNWLAGFRSIRAPSRSMPADTAYRVVHLDSGQIRPRKQHVYISPASLWPSWRSTLTSPPTPSHLPYGGRVLLCGIDEDGRPSTDSESGG